MTHYFTLDPKGVLKITHSHATSVPEKSLQVVIKTRSKNKRDKFQRRKLKGLYIKV